MYSRKNTIGERVESVLGFNDYNNYYNFFNFKTNEEMYLELLSESKSPTYTMLSDEDRKKLDEEFLKEIGIFYWEVESLINSEGFFASSIYLIDNLNPEQKEIMDKLIYIKLCLNIVNQLYGEMESDYFKTIIKNSIRINKILEECKYELKNIDSLNITDEMILNKNKDVIYIKNIVEYVEHLLRNEKKKLNLIWRNPLLACSTLMVEEYKITNFISPNEIEIDNFGYIHFEKKLPTTDLKYIPYLSDIIAKETSNREIQYGLYIGLIFLEGQDRLLKTPALI